MLIEYNYLGVYFQTVLVLQIGQVTFVEKTYCLGMLCISTSEWMLPIC
jgi:hypothetical protein